jgi:hypothetical protein
MFAAVPRYLECVLQRDSYSSSVKFRFQETDSGDYNRLRTLVCVTVNCKVRWWNRDNSLNMATDWMVEVLFSAGAKDFCLRHLERFWGPSSLVSNEYLELFRRG